jgi:tetratricopeptide (TPR) repeat protein
MLLYERTEYSITEAMRQFELAIQMDPEYAVAYAALADAYYLAGYYAFAPLARSYTKAKELVSEALRLDENLAEAQATVGVIKDHYDYDFAGAEDSFKKAVDLNPSYAQAHHWYAVTLLAMGRLDEALVELEKANEADPLSPIIRVIKGNALYYSGKSSDAMAEWLEVQRNDPTFRGLYWQRAFYHMDTLHEQEAKADIEEWAILSRKKDIGLPFLEGYFDARFGRKDEALRVLKELASTSRFPQFVAHIYAALGNKDEFFTWADKAIQERNFEIVAVRYMRVYESIRKDKKYSNLLASMGLRG